MDSEKISFIICCSCGNTPNYSVTAWNALNTRLHFGYLKPPKVLRKETEQLQLIKELIPLPKSQDIIEYVNALRRNKDPYSVWFELNLDGSKNRVFNLLTGREIE